MEKNVRTLHDYGDLSYLKPNITTVEREFPRYVGKEILVKKWLVGGREGGNCWTGDKNIKRIEAEPEPIFEELDLFLEMFHPETSFLQYKKIERELIHSHEYSINEFYGNSNRFMIKFVVVEELEKLMSEFKAHD